MEPACPQAGLVRSEMQPGCQSSPKRLRQARGHPGSKEKLPCFGAEFMSIFHRRISFRLFRRGGSPSISACSSFSPEGRAPSRPQFAADTQIPPKIPNIRSEEPFLTQPCPKINQLIN